MSAMTSRLRRAHHFFVAQSLYPLVLSSLLACAIFVGRVYLSRNRNYAFLVWNLFLAWLPYLFSLIVVLLFQGHSRWRWLMVLPAALWLIFLPNAPYMITDMLHLRERNPVPLWYDIGLLATFVWTGLFLGVVSLSAMQTIVKQMLGWVVSWAFVFGAAVLSGVGIYMGRFQNWNSWDLLFNPDEIALDMAHRLIHPIHNLQMYGVSLMFAAFLLVCYFTFTSVRNQRPLRDISAEQQH